MIEWLLVLLWVSLFPLMVGMLCYRGALWCLEGWSLARYALLALVLAVAAAGVGYGLLRWNGLLLLPGDNTWSVNFFDVSWRDDGVRFFQIFGGSLGGGAAALAARRKSRGNSGGN